MAYAPRWFLERMVMNRSVVRVLLVLPPILLVVGSLLSDAAAATASVTLVIGYVAALGARWWPGFVGASIAGALSLPVLFAPHLGVWSTVLIVVALPAVGRGMTALSPSFVPVRRVSARGASTLALSLGAALLAIVLLALVLSAPALAQTAGALFFVLIASVGVQYRRLGASPLSVEPRRVSVRAGERIDVPVTLRPGTVRCAVHLLLSVEGGAVVPGGIVAFQDEYGVIVSIAPALGGPTTVMLQASLTDGLGLVRAGRSLHVADLNVIPRARIARGAAQAFLARRSAGAEIGRLLSGEIAGFLAAQSGVEYQSSRMYVPGDSLRSVDWKHTARLQSLAVKTYDDGAKSNGLLLANLSVASAEEADRLVHEVLSAALTIAASAHAAAFAVYGHREVSRLSAVMDGSRLVASALDACTDVHVAPAWRRVSRPLSVQEAETRVARLKRSNSVAVSGLVFLLGLSSASVRRRVEASTVTALLQKGVRACAPAWCVVISAMHTDAEAVLTGLRLAERHGVRTLLVNVGDGGERAG